MEADRRIREKLVARGVKSLDDCELLSIIIGSGTDSASAYELAERLLSAGGGTLSALAKMEPRKLRMVAGLGMKRAAVLSAALELGARLGKAQSADVKTIHNPDEAANYLRPIMAALPHEEFWVIYLSSANTILGSSRVSQGGVGNISVDSRIIVKQAVETLSASIILAHNHPSGAAIPSEEDKQLTAKIKEAAALFDISVLDHLIITSGESFSFRRKGLL
jgi:DNA repair protein RadC